MARTQSDVDALWPTGKAVYVFVAQVAVPGAATITAAAQVLQTLYEGRQAMAGEFNVEPEGPGLNNGDPVYLVAFRRDVSDDYTRR